MKKHFTGKNLIRLAQAIAFTFIATLLIRAYVAQPDPDPTVRMVQVRDCIWKTVSAERCIYYMAELANDGHLPDEHTADEKE